MSTLNLETIRNLLATVEPPKDEWMLLSPDGKIYKGNVQLLMQVLAPHHPLMQQLKFGGE